jgi:hypothetical protein
MPRPVPDMSQFTAIETRHSTEDLTSPCGLPLAPLDGSILADPLFSVPEIGGKLATAAELSGFDDDDEDYGDSETPGEDDSDDEFEDFDDIDDEDFDDDFDDDFEEELEDDYEIEIEDEISAEFGLSGGASEDIDDLDAIEEVDGVDDIDPDLDDDLV